MKGIKSFYKIVICMVIIAMIPLSCIANGDTSSNETIRLGIEKFRGKDSDNFYPAYAFVDQYIYKIYEDSTPRNYSKQIYCLDAIRNFNDETNKWDAVKEYNTKINMIEDYKKFKQGQPSQVNSNETTYNTNYTNDDYEKIVRILKNTYISGTMSKDDFIKTLFSNYNAQNYHITDKDIELAEQLAIWHYTNENTSVTNHYSSDNISDLYMALYKEESKTNIIDLLKELKAKGSITPNTALTPYEYYNISDISTAVSSLQVLIDTGKYDVFKNRFDGIREMYKGFLRIAEDNTNVDIDDEKPLELVPISRTTPYVLEDGKFIIGPFKIEKKNNNYTNLNIKLENNAGNNLTDYILLDSEKNLTNKSLTELLDQEFYVCLNENTTAKKVRFSFTADYTKTDINYWTSTDQTTTQPVAVVEKTTDNVSGLDEVELETVVVDKKVVKQWNDNNNPNRSLEVNVQLIDKNTQMPKEDEIHQLNEANNWEYEWEDLDKYDSNGNEILYDVIEKDVSDEYIASTDIKDKNKDIITLTNTKKELKYDLALRKYISKIIDNNEQIIDRKPEITSEEIEKIYNGQGRYDYGTTAEKKHSKNALPVKKGNRVIYTIRVYNEGAVKAKALKITDYLPEGLSLAPESNINEFYGWEEREENRKIIDTEYGADKEILPVEQTKIYAIDLQIECIVNENANNDNLRNIAEITDDDGDDIDSTPENVHINKYNPQDSSNGIGEEDDDDYEDLKLKEYDFSLRKFVSAVGSKEIKEREPNAITNNLIPNGDEQTAIYKGSKTPVGVNVGDIVTFTIRVYNEGNEDGYVGEISDYLPEELDFIGPEYLEKTGDIASAIENLDAVMDGNIDNISSENREITEAMAFNAGFGWQYDKQTRKIYTNILAKNPATTSELGYQDYATFQNTIVDQAKATRGDSSTALLKKFNGEKLDYLDVQVKCKVNSNAKAGQRIVNIAEISKYEDENGIQLLEDRDSEPRNFPDAKKNNEYTGNGEIDGYIPGQQDDDDFDVLVIEQFDLALRKFITNVDGKDVEDRIPTPDISMLNTKDEKGDLITNVEYNHPKTPVTVVKESLITYTIRVYNEGDIDGYATEITDYLPPELEYVKDSEINEQYKWDISKDGRTATTDYLSYSKGDKNLIKAYDGKKLDYKDIQIQCKVKDTAKYEENITNLAQITDDSDAKGNNIEDRDSHPNDKFELPEDKKLPKYKDDEISKAFVPGQEEDDDFEKVKVVYFDLALRKIVSKAIVIENNGETVTETNHKFEDDPEEIVKVDLGKRKLNSVTVKFEYQIRITNEGLIEGYAKEVKDYIPEGLVFKAEENPLWKEVESGVITTDQLKDTLLKPGESKVISVLLTWKNGQDNLGLKVNTAEISKDYNKFNTPDIDSTPDNKIDGEDDIDTAPVMLSIALGNAKTYFGLSILMLSTTAIGIVLIKKIVL